MRPYDWYTKAKERIEQFLPSLDKNLEVYVDTDVITPDNQGAEYTTFMLAFSHSSNPSLQWTMEVEMNDDFIEHKLEQIVTNIYLARVE